MRGHLVWEVAGRRYVMVPRDHRITPRCYGCALGTQRVNEFTIQCPIDGRGNKLCDYGQGWKFLRIPAAKDSIRKTGKQEWTVEG